VVGCEKRNRRITPIVNPAWWAILRIKLKYGEKFQGRDPEVLEIWNLLD
jgi:hypothetical protein